MTCFRNERRSWRKALRAVVKVFVIRSLANQQRWLTARLRLGGLVVVVVILQKALALKARYETLKVHCNPVLHRHRYIKGESTYR